MSNALYLNLYHTILSRTVFTHLHADPPTRITHVPVRCPDFSSARCCPTQPHADVRILMILTQPQTQVRTSYTHARIRTLYVQM